MRRLAHGDATAFEKALLASWDTEQPSDAARNATLAALGLGAAIGTAASVTPVAGSAASIASKTLGGLTVGKVIGMLFVIGAGAAAVHYTRASTSTPSQATSRAPTAMQLASPAIASPPSKTSTDAPVVKPAIPTPKPADQIKAHPKSDLSEQVNLLDQARAAFDTGDAARTQKLVNDYEKRYRNGAFIQEAEVLRVQALVSAGDIDGARFAGEKFLSSYPKSPHAVRVRTLLGSP